MAQGREGGERGGSSGRHVAPHHSPLFDRIVRGPITHVDLAQPTAKWHPFSEPGWIFEMKYDGHRCLISRFDTPQMISRDGWEMSRVFQGLRDELERLPPRTVIDGELLMVDQDGFPEFNRLIGRSAISPPGSIARGYSRQPAALVCWDLLMLAGEDLRDRPLLERKSALKEVLRGMERVWYAGHVVQEGERMFAEAKFLDLEGIVAKRAGSIYTRGLTPNWVVIKTPLGIAIENQRNK
jgi:bifunctional non-homologous end joining protein LigD